MEALAGRLGLAETVEFLGFREDMEHHYTAAKVFVLTSASEGLSLAMMEAMACGLPAVVSAVGDLGDLVRDGVTGYLVRPPERTGFVQAIGCLLDDEPRRARLGAAALAAIQAGYTIEAGARAWRAILAPWARREAGR